RTHDELRFQRGEGTLCARSERGAAMTCGAEPAHGLHMACAGSGLRAGQGRTKEWTSVHDRVMAQGCGQTDPAPELMGAGVALPWPPCGSARLDPRFRGGRLCRPGRRCATRHHLAATARQRGPCGDIEQALKRLTSPRKAGCPRRAVHSPGRIAHEYTVGPDATAA